MTKGVKLKKAQDTKQKASTVFRDLVGEEVAVGLTKLADQSFGLKINLQYSPEIGLVMPREVDGVPIQVEVVGEIRKLDAGESSAESTEDESDPQSDEDESDHAPPLSAADEYFVILHDWFDEATIRARPELSSEISQFLTELKSEQPNAHTYEFLPLIGVRADEKKFEELKASHLARWIVQPKYAFGYYSKIMDALSALRSQTGHQAYQFLNLIGEGDSLPHPEWEGGQWPASAGYPVTSETDPGVKMDATITAKVQPGLMPVINMSMGAATNLEFLAGGDPIVIAQLASSNTHLLVVAAGNTDGLPAQAWAQTDTVLSVGATEDESGQRVATYSAIGDDGVRRTGPDVVAYGGPPELAGVEIPPSLGTPGTSYAAPRVSQLAIFCQAAIAQLHRVWANVRGEPDLGVTLMGMGVIDLNRQSAPPPRLDIPGLPFAGVRELELRAVFQTMFDAGVSFRFAIDPAALKQAIMDSATELTGYDQLEAGRGFVCLAGFIDWLKELSLSAILQRWTSLNLAETVEVPELFPFDEDGLRSLAIAVFNSRPVWVYDLANANTPFVCNQAVPISQFNAATKQARLSLNKSMGHADAVLWTRPT